MTSMQAENTGPEIQINFLPSVGAFCTVLIIPSQTPMKENLRLEACYDVSATSEYHVI
jgi:hypothetical protein